MAICEVEGIVGSIGNALSATAGRFVTNDIGAANILEGVDGNRNVFRVDYTGKVFADGGFSTGGADFAESIAVKGKAINYQPGEILVIDTSAKRQLALSREPYSPLVAGIYSTKPGIIASPNRVADRRASVGPSNVPLALVGIVPAKVTATNGAIAPGDLLVSSAKAGYAMKGTDRSRMTGAVVGKALEPLAKGDGLIQVLVTLQ